MYIFLLIGLSVLEFSHMLYFGFHMGTAVAFYLYCSAASGLMRTQGRIKRRLYMIPAGAAAAVLITNPLTHMLFVVDELGRYSRRPFISVFYFAAGFYALFSAAAVLRNGTRISAVRRFGCIMYLATAVLCVMLQYFYPHLLIEPFGMSLMLLLCYTSLEHPEEFVDSEFDTLNRRGFEYITENFVNSDTRFSVFCIKFHELDGIINTFGKKFLTECFRMIISYIGKEFPKGSFFKYSYNTFILVIKNQKQQEFYETTQKLELKFKNPQIIGDGSVMIRASIGCASYPENIRSFENLMDFAHIISEHLSGDSNIIVNADRIDTSRIERERRIREIVSDAAENGGFEVYYQPIISSKDGRAISAEALIRLKDSESGYISPEEFIPIAETQGNIVRIGEFVFRSVCRFIREQALTEKGLKYVEVNLSTIQCLQSNLSENFTKIMSSYDIAPELINLEITETTQAVFNDTFKENIISLSDMGIKFSIDDYGTGYSNTDYIFKMPFSIIKIDKNILWNAFENERAMIVLENTVNLAHRLGIEVVAEGVETETHVKKLTELGCDYFQGYYYSRPVPESEFLNVISKFNLG